MKTHTSVSASFVLAAGVLVGGACGSESYSGPCPRVVPADSCTTASNYADDLSFVTPDKVYTGWNGRDTYRAVLVANFGQFEPSSDDENIVCAARLNCPAPLEQDIIVMLTTTGPGSTNVKVDSTIPGATEYLFDIPVEVTSYTPADHDLGQARYNSPANPNGTTRRACGNCHLGQGGAPHSPLSLARYSDAELISATTTSQFPGTCEDADGARCDCTPTGEDCSSCAQACEFNVGVELTLESFGGGPGDHIFDLTAEEEVGIMAYMRALEPESL